MSMGLSDKIKREQELRRRWRRIEDRKDAKSQELRDAIHEVNRELERKRDRRRDAKTPGARERIADAIEELELHKDRLLDRLDEVRDRDEHAEKMLREHQERVRRLRDSREARRKARAGRGDLSPHFSVREFDCRDGTRVPEAAIPALRALCQDVLEPLRARHGAVFVSSGYRTRAYNARIGGADNSIHIYDAHPNAVAADKTCARGGPRDWIAATAGRADGRGLYSTFTHDDNRNRIGWPDAFWTG